jgi:ribosomal protein S18 acetylase RimI-like enzyme
LNQVRAIERATLAAVCPAKSFDIGDWQVALDPGTIRRACSAAPLDHAAHLSDDEFATIETAFENEGLRPAFRLADVPSLAQVRERVTGAGYEFEQSTLVKTAASVALTTLGEPAALFERPCEGWSDVYLGEGFDPVDGANRVAALSRCASAAFGAVVEDSRPVAVGVGVFAEGWLGVHGMRTAKAFRGRGLAGRLLAAFGAEAARRGCAHAFLQVEESNSPARSLYRRAGFSTAWRYHYWSRQAS